MRLYLDTEFMEDGETIKPLSIAVVKENGEEFYAECSTHNLLRANDFVKEFVFPNLSAYLPNGQYLSESRGAIDIQIIRQKLLNFVGTTDEIEFWGYFADYDWVIISQMFGRMVDLPNNWPMYCNDLKQEMHRLGLSKKDFDHRFPQPTTHNALDDANWVRDVHSFIRKSYV